jgi:hypothetical protein
MRMDSQGRKGYERHLFALFANIQTFGAHTYIAILNRPLWNLIYKRDVVFFKDALVSVVLTKNPPKRQVSCRIARKQPDGYVNVEVSIGLGKQGVLCVFWVV